MLQFIPTTPKKAQNVSKVGDRNCKKLEKLREKTHFFEEI